MSSSSFANGGSTDIALDQLKRPLIYTDTEPEVQSAERASSLTAITSGDCERSFIETGSGSKRRNAEYTFLPTGEYGTSHQAATVSRFYRITLDTWVPEILALLASTASIVAITAILKYYDGTISPKLPYGITLNAIVSVLATISRSMLIFAISMCIGQLKWCWYHERKRKVEDIQTMVRVTKPLNVSCTRYLS